MERHDGVSVEWTSVIHLLVTVVRAVADLTVLAVMLGNVRMAIVGLRGVWACVATVRAVCVVLGAVVQTLVYTLLGVATDLLHLLLHIVFSLGVEVLSFVDRRACGLWRRTSLFLEKSIWRAWNALTGILSFRGRVNLLVVIWFCVLGQDPAPMDNITPFIILITLFLGISFFIEGEIKKQRKNVLQRGSISFPPLRRVSPNLNTFFFVMLLLVQRTQAVYRLGLVVAVAAAGKTLVAAVFITLSRVLCLAVHNVCVLAGDVLRFLDQTLCHTSAATLSLLDKVICNVCTELVRLLDQISASFKDSIDRLKVTYSTPTYALAAEVLSLPVAVACSVCEVTATLVIHTARDVLTAAGSLVVHAATHSVPSILKLTLHVLLNVVRDVLRLVEEFVNKATKTALQAAAQSVWPLYADALLLLDKTLCLQCEVIARGFKLFSHRLIEKTAFSIYHCFSQLAAKIDGFLLDLMRQ